MTLDNTSEDGKTKTYKKTDDKGTVTIITVTTRQLTEEEIKAQFDVKFGADQYTMDAANHTVTYKGEDGKTYKASYVDREEKLTVEVQKPQEVAATGSTEAEAKAHSSSSWKKPVRKLRMPVRPLSSSTRKTARSST